MGLKLSHVLGGVLELLGTNSASSRTITFPDKDMTVAGTNDVIGVGQTWVDAGASDVDGQGARVLATDYTNDTGKPIMLLTNYTYGATATALVLTITEGVTVTIQQISGNSTYITQPQFSVVIPNGATYSISRTTANGTMTNWHELR